MGKIQFFILLLFCFAESNNFKISFKWFSDTPATESTIEVTTRKFNNSFKLHGPRYFSSLEEQEIVHEKKKEIEKSTPKKGNALYSKVRMFLGRVPLLKRSLGMECWQEIGCFSAMSFNDMVNGHIAMLPMGPEEIDPTFYLLDSASEPLIFKHNFNENEMRNSSFDPDLITVIIVHGYYKAIEEWMIKTVENLKRVPDEDFNYIFVDWSKGSKVLNFALAASNTQVVGALVSYFIDRLCNTYKNESLTHERFHLIGHSLGSHVMGFAGKRLKNPKVSRITGLDPAGPGFRDKKAEHRLDYSDASLVVVIHTDMAEFVTQGLGIYEPIGDVDFYPNGGKQQPGCPPSKIVENVLQALLVDSKRDFSCSHNRAPVLLYTPDDLDTGCLPVGYYCENWETFLEGRCANCQSFNQLNRCQLMGLFPFNWENVIINKENKNSNKFYLNTGRNKNLCIFHYQIAFHFSNDSDSITNQMFSLKIKAQVDQKDRYLIFKRKLSQLKNGYIHTMLVTFNFNITRFYSMDVKWFKSDDLFFAFSDTKITIQFIEINYMSHYRAETRNDFSIVLCPKREGVIRPDVQNISFVKCKNGMKPKGSALRMISANLFPFTDRADITSTDFDNQELVANKMTKAIQNRWYYSKPTGQELGD